jgi:DNA polymerase III alpha subunit
VHQEDAELLTQVQALQEHRTILDPAPAAAARHHLCSAKELAELQAAFPQALANTQTLVHSLIDSASLAYFIELGNNLDESVNLPQTGIEKDKFRPEAANLVRRRFKKTVFPGGTAGERTANPGTADHL